MITQPKPSKENYWVKFDVCNPDTYPPMETGTTVRSIKVVTSGGDVCRFIYATKEWLFMVPEELDTTYWQPLPKFIY
jgi:hypothetical protein